MKTLRTRIKKMKGYPDTEKDVINLDGLPGDAQIVSVECLYDIYPEYMYVIRYITEEEKISDSDNLIQLVEAVDKPNKTRYEQIKSEMELIEKGVEEVSDDLERINETT